MNRQSDPTLFWLKAVRIAVVVPGVLYLAVFGLRRREAGAARSASSTSTGGVGCLTLARRSRETRAVAWN
ncbi:hypothetical protein [Sphingomonas sp. Mn802worker]|uniref:hypothetical protein n=1 Tax=Sphingomonas sp. Mn802worker TaxID=629773 RepID=UPI00037E3399|nr:hypothetical protein [Sphingomonas sp. Mn802worker]